MFSVYFELGLEHIADLNGYDHILFIVVLAASKSWREWKKLLVLITAFTLGHSITLALASLKIISVNSSLVEFLIPLTIFISSVFNYFSKSDVSKKFDTLFYLSALFFGTIHGMGFSNYLSSLLGKSSNIFLPLFAFNVGLEIGQIFILAILLLFSFVMVDVARVQKREWTLLLSGAGAGLSIVMMLERSLW